MSYLRRQDKVPATGRLTVRFTTAQRDFFESAPEVPQALRHLLHRAAVKEGKLSLRLTLDEINVLIVSASRIPKPPGEAGRRIDALIDYLEDMGDRFESGRDDASD